MGAFRQSFLVGRVMAVMNIFTEPFCIYACMPYLMMRDVFLFNA
jgi:hypothetical protein